MKPELIRLNNVTKVYGAGEAAVVALDRINITIGAGEFVAVLGPSGSGKSTAMNILGCLDTPTSGHYYFHGVDVGTLSRDQRALLRRNYIGFVFQGFNLLKRTSALENLELPLIYRGTPARQRHELARKALALVGLSDREAHSAAELSGGQQQRVAIARALVTEPDVIFADEPTGNLDRARSHEVMALFTRLNEEHGITIVIVTHDNEIAAYAKRHIRFIDGKVASDTINMQRTIAPPRRAAS
jgi:putative ABC transport system ATP-binding protein